MDKKRDRKNCGNLKNDGNLSAPISGKLFFGLFFADIPAHTLCWLTKRIGHPYSGQGFLCQVQAFVVG